MNKAKFLLSALGVVAIAAAAFASKIPTFIYQRTVANTTICELTVLNATLTEHPSATTTLVNTFATTIKGAECTLPVTVYKGDL